MKNSGCKRVRVRKAVSAVDFDVAFEVRLDNLDKVMKDLEKRMRRFQKLTSFVP